MATPGSIRERLPEWCLSLEGPRKLVLNGLILIFSLLGSGVVIKAALKQVYVVDAISVPKDLEANGYTSVTVGQRIIDAVSDINRVATMTKQVGIYALSEADPSRPDSADFEGPGQTHAASALEAVVLSGDDLSAKYDVSVGGISLNTMIFYVRELFGLTDTKISGEIIAEKPAATVGKDEKPAATKYSIRLRVSDKGLVQHEGEATDILATLFEDGALKLVERFDPLNAGYYSYYKRDYENALRIARAYLVRGTKDDEEWALNLLGMVSHARFRHDEARAQKGYDDAIASFRDLRRRYPQFAPGLYNLGVALIDKGDLLQQQDKDAAYRHYKDAREVALQGIQIEEAGGKGARGSAIGYATAGNALRSMARWEAARYDDALQYFKLSVKANPMFVYAYLSQGNIFYSRRAPEEANLSYQLATEICPSAQTFTRVGALLLQFGRESGRGSDVPACGRAQAIALCLHILGHGPARFRAHRRGERIVRKGHRGRPQRSERLQPIRPHVSRTAPVGRGDREVHDGDQSLPAMVELPIQPRSGVARRRQARSSDPGFRARDRDLPAARVVLCPARRHAGPTASAGSCGRHREHDRGEAGEGSRDQAKRRGGARHHPRCL